MRPRLRRCCRIQRHLASWNGWSPSITNTRFQSTAAAGLTAEQVPKLTLQWAFGFPDATSAWSQPTVAAGRLFIGGQNGTVYSLDAKSGCIQWTFTAKSGVRTALAFGPREGSSGFAVYFGDTGANVYALDAATGRELWSRRMDDHPLARITGSPTLFRGRLYVPVSSIEETAAVAARLRLLHVPRQHQRARRENRRRRLAEVPGP